MKQSADILTTVAIEDDPLALNDLEAMIKKVPKLRLLKSFTDSLQAVKYLQTRQHVHIVFCDIEMPTLNGWQIYDMVENHCERFIFTTGHPQHTAKSYNKGIDGYLVKPVDKELIQQIVSKVERGKEQTLVRANKKIFIKNGDEILAYDPDSIVSIHSAENYISVETTSGTQLVRMKMREAQKRFEATGQFIRIHRQTIVSKAMIKGWKFGIVRLENGKEYAISKSYQKHFEQCYRDYLL